MDAPLNNTVLYGDFTISTWFNAFDMANPWPTLLAETNGTLLMEIVGQTSNAQPPTRIGDFAAYDAGPPNIHQWYWFMERFQQTPLNTYCQIVITKAGTNVVMYLNSQITVTSQAVSSSHTPSVQHLIIGKQQIAGPSAYSTFHGVIDDIRIYNRALSASEVTALYEIESGPRVDLIKAVKPSFSKLTLTTNYQLQISTDMSTWTNYGSAFTATNTSMIYPQYFDVDNWGQLFFRIQEVP